jgi:hypothetical protein
MYENQDTLIHPCLCSGSMKYVHTDCLDKWRIKNSYTFSTCPTCQYNYHISEISTNRKSVLIKFYFWICFDLICCLIGFESISFILGLLIDRQNIYNQLIYGHLMSIFLIGCLSSLYGIFYDQNRQQQNKPNIHVSNICMLFLIMFGLIIGIVVSFIGAFYFVSYIVEYRYHSIWRRELSTVQIVQNKY